MKYYYLPLKASLLSIVIVLITSCTNVMLVPFKQHYYTPDDFETSYEDVYMQSATGLKLHGWRLITSQKKKGNILFLHGNAGNVSTHFSYMYWLTEYGYDIYIFDYRGYGKSEGRADLDGVILDAGAMIDHMIANTADDEQLLVIGHSLGGALAIYAVAESGGKSRIDSLVTIEAFSDYRDIAQEAMSKSWLFWLFQWPLSYTIDNTYRPLDKVGQVTPVPLLILHSEMDEIIDIHHADRLYAAANEPKVFKKIDSNHNNIFAEPHNRAVLLEYLEQLEK